MRRILALLPALASAASVAGCQTPQQQNALGGAAAPQPAYYGALALPPIYGGPPPPAYFGLPPGPPPGSGRCAQWVFDYNGNRVCTAYD
jgi:hypothetical protein